MIEIEQHFVGKMSFAKFCAWLSKNSVLEPQEDVTGFLGCYGHVKRAQKIRHIREDKSVRFVLEVYELNDDGTDRYVSLTMNEDFTGKGALEAYRQFKALKV